MYSIPRQFGMCDRDSPSRGIQPRVKNPLESSRAGKKVQLAPWILARRVPIFIPRCKTSLPLFSLDRCAYALLQRRVSCRRVKLAWHLGSGCRVVVQKPDSIPCLHPRSIALAQRNGPVVLARRPDISEGATSLVGSWILDVNHFPGLGDSRNI